MKIIENMGRIIKDKKLTQEEAAEMLGISQPTLNLYLSQKREIKLPFIEKFCAVFNVSLTQLTGETAVSSLSKEDLIEIIDVIENWAIDNKCLLSTKNKVELAYLLYDEVKGTPADARKAKIIQFANFLQKADRIKAVNQ